MSHIRHFPCYFILQTIFYHSVALPFCRYVFAKKYLYIMTEVGTWCRPMIWERTYIKYRVFLIFGPPFPSPNVTFRNQSQSVAGENSISWSATQINIQSTCLCAFCKISCPITLVSAEMAIKLQKKLKYPKLWMLRRNTDRHLTYW